MNLIKKGITIKKVDALGWEYIYDTLEREYAKVNHIRNTSKKDDEKCWAANICQQLYSVQKQIREKEAIAES